MLTIHTPRQRPANDCARYCDRCGVSAWHPEVARCVAAACPARAPREHDIEAAA